ncbi:uncharacterized protein VTP21DRAFT_3663 [Calcarisporiella thermophila]|uniref:uncharacterized protein n=1 Tax=Calcarisporiella thermophila TaxID=911321 RepID=UPI0037433D8C
MSDTQDLQQQSPPPQQHQESMMPSRSDSMRRKPNTPRGYKGDRKDKQKHKNEKKAAENANLTQQPSDAVASPPMQQQPFSQPLSPPQMQTLAPQTPQKQQQSQQSQNSTTPVAQSPVATIMTEVEGQQVEVIPTAIVIKNIPFSLKRDALLAYMSQLDIPKPYAFNYHFDNGVFRGLAFANFRTMDETAQVVQILNGCEVGGRKLRVEYKKVLAVGQSQMGLGQAQGMATPEKPEKKPQVNANGKDLGVQVENAGRKEGGESKKEKKNGKKEEKPSEDRASGRSPQPQRQPMTQQQQQQHQQQQMYQMQQQLDVLNLNDPMTLQFYDQLLLFRGDGGRDELVYSGLNLAQQRVVQMIAQKLQLYYYTTAAADSDRETEQQLHIARQPAPAVKPPQLKSLNHRPSRERLAATNSGADHILRKERSMPDLVGSSRSALRKAMGNGAGAGGFGLGGVGTMGAGVSGDFIVVQPVRQPKGPEPGRNFAARMAVA